MARLQEFSPPFQYSQLPPSPDGALKLHCRLLALDEFNELVQSLVDQHEVSRIDRHKAHISLDALPIIYRILRANCLPELAIAIHFLLDDQDVPQGYWFVTHNPHVYRAARMITREISYLALAKYGDAFWQPSIQGNSGKSGVAEIASSLHVTIPKGEQLPDWYSDYAKRLEKHVLGEARRLDKAVVRNLSTLSPSDREEYELSHREMRRGLNTWEWRNEWQGRLYQEALRAIEDLEADSPVTISRILPDVVPLRGTEASRSVGKTRRINELARKVNALTSLRERIRVIRETQQGYVDTANRLVPLLDDVVEEHIRTGNSACEKIIQQLTQLGDRLHGAWLLAMDVHQMRPRQIPTSVRRAVYARDKSRCVVCGTESSLHIDHILPFSFGGDHTEANLRLLCKTCHDTRHYLWHLKLGRWPRIDSVEEAIELDREPFEELCRRRRCMPGQHAADRIDGLETDHGEKRFKRSEL